MTAFLEAVTGRVPEQITETYKACNPQDRADLEANAHFMSWLGRVLPDQIVMRTCIKCMCAGRSFVFFERVRVFLLACTDAAGATEMPDALRKALKALTFEVRIAYYGALQGRLPGARAAARAGRAQPGRGDPARRRRAVRIAARRGRRRPRDGARRASRRRLAGDRCPEPDRGVLPEWARTGFSDPEPRIAHVIGDEGRIAAIIFGTRSRPRRAGRRQQDPVGLARSGAAALRPTDPRRARRRGRHARRPRRPGAVGHRPSRRRAAGT